MVRRFLVSVPDRMIHPLGSKDGARQYFAANGD
jgi:hypothetical protein